MADVQRVDECHNDSVISIEQEESDTSHKPDSAYHALRHRTIQLPQTVVFTNSDEELGPGVRKKHVRTLNRILLSQTLLRVAVLQCRMDL